MKKWKYEKEIAIATEILLNAYKTLSHSKTITVIFTVNNDIYYHDLSDNELTEIARLNSNIKLSTQTATKKRINKYLENAVKFATIADLQEIKNSFPKYNNGYLSEFLYRIKVTNETIENIKHSNNSKSFDNASDTNDNKQLKNIDNGATFTTLEYLLKAAKQKALDNITEIENAIEMLNKIYSE